jgi:hypothetical protein
MLTNAYQYVTNNFNKQIFLFGCQYYNDTVGMEHSHIRVKKSYAATSRRRDTCLLEMHQLSATTMRSSTLFRHLQTTEAAEEEEEEEEEEADDVLDIRRGEKRGRDGDGDDDLNIFSSISRKKSRVIFAEKKEEWVIDPKDTNCGIHPWLTSSVVTKLLVNHVDVELVSRMLTPCSSRLQLDYVQGITCLPSKSSGMNAFTVYATR